LDHSNGTIAIQLPHAPLFPPTLYRLPTKPNSIVSIDQLCLRFAPLRFFQSLDRIVQTEPWLPRDRLIIDMLKSVDIEKGTVPVVRLFLN
jgi:hypothetical protein